MAQMVKKKKKSTCNRGDLDLIPGSGRSPALSLSPLHLVLFLEFYLVPAFETCYSITSFCLICCFYFCVSSSLVMFPDVREVAFCRRHPIF